MSKTTNISWTDATWPIVSGCDYVSRGCSNCWAVRVSWRLAHNPNPKVSRVYKGTVKKTRDGKLAWTGVVRPLPERLTWPLHWRKPLKIFVCSQADLFHEDVPEKFIYDVFTALEFAPWHTYQILTKRAKRMRELILANLASTGLSSAARAHKPAPARASAISSGREKRATIAARQASHSSANSWDPVRSATSRPAAMATLICQF